WEITLQGVTPGGPGAAELMARATAEEPLSGASTALLKTPVLPTQHAQPAADARAAAELRAAVVRPTARLAPPADASGESRLDIDLDVAPAILRAKKPDPQTPPREYKTEVIRAFDLTD